MNISLQNVVAYSKSIVHCPLLSVMLAMYHVTVNIPFLELNCFEV